MSDVTTIKADIQQRYGKLKTADNDMRRAALRNVSTQTTPLFKALRDECAETGHQWKYDHHNWDHSCSWDACVWCGELEQTDKHNKIATDDKPKSDCSD